MANSCAKGSACLDSSGRPDGIEATAGPRYNRSTFTGDLHAKYVLRVIFYSNANRDGSYSHMSLLIFKLGVGVGLWVANEHRHYTCFSEYINCPF
jgi:hypothetical protein